MATTMSDQAAKLRQLIQTATVAPCDGAAGMPMVVVAGAKRRVGATTIAVNLAAVLVDRGERALLVDAAEHGNALAESAGVGREFEYAVGDVMAGKCGIAEAIVPGAMGVRVLASRWRDGSAADVSRKSQHRLLSAIESVRDEFDLIVVDAGQGLTAWTRRLWAGARLVVLVTTSDADAILDAYSAMKRCSAEGMRPAVRMLVNQVETDAEADDVHRRMKDACRRFLSLEIETLPPLPRCGFELAACASAAPRVWEAPNSSFGRATLWLGRSVGNLMAGAGGGAAMHADGLSEIHELVSEC